jgi:hypothetical protein
VHSELANAQEVARFFEDTPEIFAPEERLAARKPIGLRYQVLGDLSRRCKYILAGNKTPWRIELMTTLSDQVAAMMNPTGEPLIVFFFQQYAFGSRFCIQCPHCFITVIVTEGQMRTMIREELYFIGKTLRPGPYAKQ